MLKIRHLRKCSLEGCENLLFQKGRRDRKFCSEACKKKAKRAREGEDQSNLKGDAAGQSRSGSGSASDSDSNGVPFPNLFVADSRFARTDSRGFVLCAGCGQPTRQRPVIPDPSPGLNETAAVPVYHTECYHA